jgi:UDP-N-acetylglucosamine acyltransferase
VIFSNNGTLAGHVEVGDYAIIGGLTAVHQFCRIGADALTGGCSKIVQDVPPFMIADGNPAKVRSYNKVALERNGFSDKAHRAIKEAYRLIYRSALNLQQAVEQIRTDLPETPEITLLLEFVTNSPRGIIK